MDAMGDFYYWGLGAGFLMQGCSRKPASPAPDGEALFTKNAPAVTSRTTTCERRTPNSLRQMTAASILAALQSGRMKWEAKFLSSAQKLQSPSTWVCKNVSTAGGDDRSLRSRFWIRRRILPGGRVGEAIRRTAASSLLLPQE